MREPNEVLPLSAFISRDIVYIFRGENGECLYVGRSTKGWSRINLAHHIIKQHQSEIASVELYYCADWIEAGRLEMRFIYNLDPRYNGKEGQWTATMYPNAPARA